MYVHDLHLSSPYSLPLFPFILFEMQLVADVRPASVLAPAADETVVRHLAIEAIVHGRPSKANLTVLADLLLETG